MKETEGSLAIHKKRQIFKIGICLVVLITGMILSLGMGAVDYTVPEIFHHLLERSQTTDRLILRDVRLPRTLVAAVVGMCLSVSGAIMQGITRNPMASPSVLGVTNGASLVTLILFAFFPTAASFTPIAAVTGAFLTTMLIYGAAWKGGVAPVRFILSGVAVSSVLSAIYSVISTLYPDAIVGMIGFNVGSLQARTWHHLQLLLPYAVVGLTASLFFTNRLNILAMGDEVAKGLGVSVESIRLILIVISSILAGSAVSVVGQIAFVGLCMPHITRMLVGSDYRYLLPASAINGASMVVYCDLAARLVIKPQEMEVGIIIAVIGAPFFLYLLRKKVSSI